jgi:hypothetical protein
MYHTVNAKTFRLLHERFNDFAKLKQVKDPKILPLLKKLNATPGIVTVFSCQGHKDEGKSPYIMLAVTSAGYKRLMKMYSIITDHITHGGLLYSDKIYLELKTMRTPFGDGGKPYSSIFITTHNQLKCSKDNYITTTEFIRVVGDALAKVQ